MLSLRLALRSRRSHSSRACTSDTPRPRRSGSATPRSSRQPAMTANGGRRSPASRACHSASLRLVTASRSTGGTTRGSCCRAEESKSLVAACVGTLVSEPRCWDASWGQRSGAVRTGSSRLREQGRRPQRARDQIRTVDPVPALRTAPRHSRAFCPSRRAERASRRAITPSAAPSCTELPRVARGDQRPTQRWRRLDE